MAGTPSILEAAKAQDIPLAVQRLEDHIEKFASLILKHYPEENHA